MLRDDPPWIRQMLVRFSLFFFFQAEDGIRDRNVTGVQTCALPISARDRNRSFQAVYFPATKKLVQLADDSIPTVNVSDDGKVALANSRERYMIESMRSEERRVGKECRTGRGPYHQKKKIKREE